MSEGRRKRGELEEIGKLMRVLETMEERMDLICLHREVIGGVFLREMS